MWLAINAPTPRSLAISDIITPERIRREGRAAMVYYQKRRGPLGLANEEVCVFRTSYGGYSSTASLSPKLRRVILPAYKCANYYSWIALARQQWLELPRPGSLRAQASVIARARAGMYTPTHNYILRVRVL